MVPTKGLHRGRSYQSGGTIVLRAVEKVHCRIGGEELTQEGEIPFTDAHLTSIRVEVESTSTMAIYCKLYRKYIGMVEIYLYTSIFELGVYSKTQSS
jgi:hypothetical protein